MDEKERCLFNSTSSNACAYCSLHNVGLTAKQVKKRECLKKQCWHLIKNENHKWWEQRERQKKLRKERKERLSQ